MTPKTFSRTTAALAVAALFLVGATCMQPGLGNISTSHKPKVTISEVSVPAPNQIKISADGPMDSAVVVLEDPIRIGVDVPNASIAGSPPMALSGGVIQQVEIISGKAGIMGVRVLAYLSGDATYNLEAQGNDLILSLTPTGGVSTSSTEDENQQIYDATMDELDRVLSGSAPEPYSSGPTTDYVSSGGDYYSRYSTGPNYLTPMPPPNADGSASVIGDIYYRTIRDGIQIMIYTNGDAGNFVDYESQSPPRITVEVPNVTAQKPRAYNINWSGVHRVRVTNNRKNYNARVSVDLNRSLPAYDINKTNSGIVITVFEEDYARGGVRHSTHVTSQGETLRGIARQYYGNEAAWMRIYTANREAFTRREDKLIKKYQGDVPLGAGIFLYIPGR